MRSRRVPVLRLGSRGPGGDARSLRLCPQAFAIVRKRPQSFAIVRKRPQSFASVRSRSQCVGLAGETKIVAKRRTVVTVYVSHYKSVNSHADQGGRGRETQNCRHFWIRLGSSRLKSVNSHRDPWGVVVAKRKTVVTFGLVSGLRVSKVSTATRIGGVVVAKRRTVVTFGLVSGLRVSKVSTATGIHGGSWSRNAKLSSLLDSSRVFASQKCQQPQGSMGGRGRETQNCRHFWTRLGSSRLKSVNSHRDRGGSGR